jgi:transposase-like protein
VAGGAGAWTAEQKAQIVIETYTSGETVSAVAQPARIDAAVFELPRKEGEQADASERLAATKGVLRSLRQYDDGHDASPQALRALSGCTDAFARMPRIVPLTNRSRKRARMRL